MRKLSFYLFIFLLYPGRSPAQDVKKDSIVSQKDIIDVVIKATHWETKKKARPSKKVYFSIIPLAASSNPNGKVVVSSVNAAFYLGDPDSTNLSNVSFTPYTNFTSRFGFTIRPNLWLANNKWNVPGELRIANNIFDFYGIGANSSSDPKGELDYNHARMYMTVHRLLLRHFYAGMGYNLDYFYNIRLRAFESVDTSTQSVTSSGLSLNLLRDSRKNSINPRGGYYATLIYKINGPALGSTNSWTSLYFDSRKYLRLSDNNQNILGFWALYWGTYGDVPYLNYPGTALDLYARTGRGYAMGRFRGKQMLYAECEYRFALSANGLWGAVIFANAQSYTELISGKFEYIKPAGGLGVRIKFNKRSDMNLTLDMAFGKDSFAAYLNLGEFF